MAQRALKFFTVLATALTIAACGGGSGGGALGGNIGGGGATSCSLEGQKQFLSDFLQNVHLTNDQLTDVDITTNLTVEQYLAALIANVDLAFDDPSVTVPDTFTFITTPEADSSRFELGEFIGFGFSVTFVGDDLLIARAFADSPAGRAGFQRGQQMVAIDGRTIAQIEAAEGLTEAFGPTEIGVERTFTMRNPDGSEFDAVLTKTTSVIDPVPQIRTYTIDGSTFGYIEFASFIETARDPLEDAFIQFNNAGITDVILDMRYNGGGLVSIANLLGDYLGGAVADGLVFSETRFNDNNAASNSIEFFQRLANSGNLSRLVVISTRGTASASELVINGLEPHISVQLVGDRTFGKPVGQIREDFCSQALRVTAFETVNSLGEGRYFTGIPVDCEAADDILTPVGDPLEASTAAALTLLSTGACPSVTAANKVQQPVQPFRPVADGRTRAQIEAYAW